MYPVHRSQGYITGGGLPNEDVTTGHPGRWSRGPHEGGLQIAMCDGAVKFVSDNVSHTVWRNSFTREGRETDNLD